MLDFGFYNMDCMEGMKQFPDNYFDLAIVDPPYGDVTQGGYMQNKGRINDKKADMKNYHLGLWGQNKPTKEYFYELFRVSKNSVIWGGNYFVKEIGRDSQCWLVWNKKRAPGTTYADAELAWTSFNSAVRMFDFRWDGFIQEDMANKEFRIHPTQKPVALYKWILSKYAKPGDKILDTHVGSASSLIACHEMHLDYVGFEIDKTYFEQAQDRLKRETSQMDIYDFLGDKQ